MSLKLDPLPDTDGQWPQPINDCRKSMAVDAAEHLRLEQLMICCVWLTSPMLVQSNWLLVDCCVIVACSIVSSVLHGKLIVEFVVLLRV